MFLFALLSFQYSFAGGVKKDTVQALVVSQSSAENTIDLTNLSGGQIIGLIDSLLDLEAVPTDLVKEINDYAESKLLKHDFYISLTGFYDNSMYPSNSMYKKWDTYNLYPYEEALRSKDDEINLILQDTLNFCNFVPPIKGLITSNFGYRDGRNHNGMDIDLQVWDPVKSSFDGMVRISRMHPGYGRVVVIRHYNGLETLYAHLHRLKVKPGDIVEAGQVIGLGGSSGRSTGSHLHFEVRFKGKPINPRSLIDFNNNKLVSDSLKLIKNKWSYTAVPLGIEYHTVKPGEHLFGIARKYGTSISHLCELNGIRRNKPLRVGQKLRIGA
ncbi:MAG: LysM peptidoglycan-binding domain-containing protein [Bacteroidetes bacterium]|nr:MAG: LysM peptidoglycan-binding domain-containing protein [Bacteroidota bacterium]MBL1144142.1 LysM peptidoglycan-binding domain-containing protein [Bacteroidota bacterium]